MTAGLRALIVDDEAVARRRIRRLLEQEAGMTVAGECADGAAALEAIREARPDLVFLDVQMPELDGFEVVQRLPVDDLPAVVFVTAYDRYALRAFDVHAIDYLLKPYTRERFRTAVTRARQRVAASGRGEPLRSLIDDLHRRASYLKRISVKTGERIVLVDVAAIDWIQAADNYVALHAAGRTHLLRETLAGLERQLDPDRFVRIHRSTLVQIDRLAELRPATHGDYDVLLTDGTRLTLSRTWRPRVERALGRSL